MFSNAPIIEPYAVVDTFVSDVALIEHLGNGLMRFTLCSGHQSVTDNRLERVVVARLVMSAADVQRAVLATEIALAGIEGSVGPTRIERGPPH